MLLLPETQQTVTVWSVCEVSESFRTSAQGWIFLRSIAGFLKSLRLTSSSRGHLRKVKMCSEKSPKKIEMCSVHELSVLAASLFVIFRSSCCVSDFISFSEHFARKLLFLSCKQSNKPNFTWAFKMPFHLQRFWRVWVFNTCFGDPPVWWFKPSVV